MEEGLGGDRGRVEAGVGPPSVTSGDFGEGLCLSRHVSMWSARLLIGRKAPCAMGGGQRHLADDPVTPPHWGDPLVGGATGPRTNDREAQHAARGRAQTRRSGVIDETIGGLSID